MSILTTYSFHNIYTDEVHTIFEVMIENTSYLTGMDLAALLGLSKSNQALNRLGEKFMRVEDISAAMPKVKLVNKYGAVLLSTKVHKGELGKEVCDWLMESVIPQMEEHEMQAIINARASELSREEQIAAETLIVNAVMNSKPEPTPEHIPQRLVQKIVVEGVEYEAVVK